MVDADLVLRQMDGAGTKLNLLLLDACRIIRSPRMACTRCRAAWRDCVRRRELDLLRHTAGQCSRGRDRREQPVYHCPRRDNAPAGPGYLSPVHQVGLQVERSTGGNQKALGFRIAHRWRVLFRWWLASRRSPAWCVPPQTQPGASWSPNCSATAPLGIRGHRTHHRPCPT